MNRRCALSVPQLEMWDYRNRPAETEMPAVAVGAVDVSRADGEPFVLTSETHHVGDSSPDANSFRINFPL